MLLGIFPADDAKVHPFLPHPDFLQPCRFSLPKSSTSRYNLLNYAKNREGDMKKRKKYVSLQVNRFVTD